MCIIVIWEKMLWISKEPSSTFRRVTRYARNSDTSPRKRNEARAGYCAGLLIVSINSTPPPQTTGRIRNSNTYRKHKCQGLNQSSPAHQPDCKPKEQRRCSMDRNNRTTVINRENGPGFTYVTPPFDREAEIKRFTVRYGNPPEKVEETHGGKYLVLGPVPEGGE
jgi:hypothetical protein